MIYYHNNHNFCRHTLSNTTALILLPITSTAYLFNYCLFTSDTTTKTTATTTKPTRTSTKQQNKTFYSVYFHNYQNYYHLSTSKCAIQLQQPILKTTTTRLEQLLYLIVILTTSTTYYLLLVPNYYYLLSTTTTTATCRTIKNCKYKSLPMAKNITTNTIPTTIYTYYLNLLPPLLQLLPLLQQQ